MTSPSRKLGYSNN